MEKLTKKERRKTRRRFTTVGLALMMVLGMSATAMAIPDGTYDFYGTYETDAYYADGAGPAYECSMDDFGYTCPTQVGGFCVLNLHVVDNSITSGDGGPYYGIAVEKLTGGLTAIDLDGAGPVALTVGDTGAASVYWTLDMGTMEAGCGEKVCVDEVDTDKEGDPGVAGTVTGEIPVELEGYESKYTSCEGDERDYPTWIVTTETATATISNEEDINPQPLPISGARLTGSDPTYTLELVDSIGVMREVVLGFALGTDTFTTDRWTGTLCRRTSPAESCVSGFTCPDEED